MALRDELEDRGYVCSYWRDLFSKAKNAESIALLPTLIKKIPTFDYAVLICEGHDLTTIHREDATETVSTMRDNVLFEIGLCTMALGLTRTILVTDEAVRMPDDLTGINNSCAVKRIIYKNCDKASSESTDTMHSVSKEIDDYIKETGDILTPVVIGAASSIACGYVSNFVFRTLEHIDDGVYIGDDSRVIKFPVEKIFMHIVLPETFTKDTSEHARSILDRYPKGRVLTARNRQAEFKCEIVGDELHIIDFPTSMVTSYDTARMILNIDADDTLDKCASERFTAKELNLFEATLKNLLNREYLRQVIDEHYSKIDADERALIVDRVADIITERVYVVRQNY